MDLLLREFNMCLWILAVWTSQGSSRKHDICNWRTYNASCAENEVIQIEHAHYGRMSLGSCLEQAYGNIGCKLDVLSYLESLCSGRQFCNLEMPDKYLASGHQPCPPGLVMYLEIRYRCIQGQTSPMKCDSAPLPVSRQKGLLSNSITGKTRQGSADCPWEVRAAPGQTIRLTLHDYGVWTPPVTQGVSSEGRETEVSEQGKSGICLIYARITEVNTESSITVCGGETREKVIYTSETDAVQITLMDPQRTKRSTYFTIQYEIVGCQAYKPPEGALIDEIEETRISVRCTVSGKEWVMDCDNAIWKTVEAGVVENCTTLGEPSAMATLFGGNQGIQREIVITIIVAVTIVLAAIVAAVGLVCAGSRRGPVLASKDTDNYQTWRQDIGAERKALMIEGQGALTGGAYTTTLHREMAVPQSAMTPGGDFPPLPPLPPKATDTAQWPFPRTADAECDFPERNTSTLKSSRTKPTYEQARFSRRSLVAPFYQELDIQRPDCNFGPESEDAMPNAGIPTAGAHESPDGYLTARLEAK